MTLQPLKAALYLRLSQDREGRAVKVDEQERDCRQLAEREGWQVMGVYVDNDTSATKTRRGERTTRGRRPAYDRMLTDVEHGLVTAVVAYHPDRLYRRLPDLEELVDLAESRRMAIRTVSAGEIDLATASGRMNARLIGVVARGEAERMGERLTRGKRHKAEAGGWNGGPRPYAYEPVSPEHRTADGPVLQLVDCEAEVVCGVAEQLLSGASLRGCAMRLNAEGHVTTMGTPWTGSALRKVVLRPTTAGLRVCADGSMYPGRWAAPVICAARLRKGSTNSARGAAVWSPTRSSPPKPPGPQAPTGMG